MNANRKKATRTLKKAVMATVLAGTLASSVASVGPMGISGVQVAMAEELEENGLKYIVDDGMAIITGCTGTEVTIPETIGGYAIKAVQLKEKNSELKELICNL